MTATNDAAAREPLLELRGVTHSYGSADARFPAVENISLTLFAGQFGALVGPSGCGKSTLLRIITGLQRPDAGQVLYRGRPLRGVNEHAAMVFQTFALFPWLTVQGNVEKALEARGVAKEERRRRAVEVLDRVGLDGFETAYPRELSGGMRQKVGFARAMAVEPELLCLDEPFSSLDVLGAQTLRGELIELWTTGKIPTKAILLVTHNIEEAAIMADRIVVMDKHPGRIIADRRVELPHPRHRKDAKVVEVMDRTYAQLTGETQSEQVELGAAPGESGRVRPIPNVSVADLAGFLERLAQAPSQTADLYRFAEELQISTDQLLALVEAAELLGFARVAKGDITLAPLGETFADASILARKGIFAARIRRLPVFRWLLTLLQVMDEPQLDWADALTALEVEFPRQEAEQQLEKLVRWGRYAEVLAFDDATRKLYLEQAEEAGKA